MPSSNDILIYLYNFFQSQNDEAAKKLVTHVAAIVLSSKNLIPINASDEITFGIIKRIVALLTNNAIHFNDNALKKIIDNVFMLSAETKRLHLQFQQILTLLQSQKLCSNAKICEFLWLKGATCIQDNANIDTPKDIVYDYIEWVVKNSKIDQVSKISFICNRPLPILIHFQF